MSRPDFPEPEPIDYTNPPRRFRTEDEQDLLEYLDGYDDLQPFARTTTTYPRGEDS